MRLGEMRQHPSYTYLRSTKKMVQKKWWTTKQSLSKKQKKQVVVVGPPIQKILGKMGLGEMLPNPRKVTGTFVPTYFRIHGTFAPYSRVNIIGLHT